jgi:hypothetical protein
VQSRHARPRDTCTTEILGPRNDLREHHDFQSRIGTSPYHLITGQHVNLKYCHAFWSKCYVHIAVKDRQGKVGFPRAYKAHFVGYDFVHTLTPTYKVMQVYPNGTYGVVRNSKVVIFDTTIDFKDVNTIFSEDTTFEEYCIGAEPPLQLPQYAPPAPLLIQDIPPVHPQPVHAPVYAPALPQPPVHDPLARPKPARATHEIRPPPPDFSTAPAPVHRDSVGITETLPLLRHRIGSPLPIGYIYPL